MGYRHSSVDLSVPTYHSVVQGSNPKHTICNFSFTVKLMLNLYLPCEKNENKQKEDGFRPSQKQFYNYPEVLQNLYSKTR